MNENTRTAAARAFVRSLNILLKFARMYDFGHPRTAKQYETAWTELRTALGAGTDNEAGVLLAVSGDQLLLDGTALESAQSEKSFARMLSAAGIASIHFAPQVTQASLARFVRGFPTGTGAKPVQLAEQLKAALQGDPHIHVNEVCFVPADSAVAKSTVAAQLAARTLSMNPGASEELFNDPEKLLQLIVAAEGTKGNGGGPGGGGPGNGGSGGGNGEGWGEGSDEGSGNGGGDDGNGRVGSGYEVRGSRRGSARRKGKRAGSGTGIDSGTDASRFANASGEDGLGNHDSESEADHGSGAGATYYAPEPAEIVRDFPAGSEISGGGNPVFVSGSGHAEGGGNSAADGAGPNTWNIVGGSGGGTPLSPDAAGFWFNKGGAGESSSGTASESALNGISIHGVGGTGTSSGSGPGSGSSGNGGSGGRSDGRGGSSHRGGSGQGGGSSQGGGSGRGSGPATTGGSRTRGWNLAGAAGGAAESAAPSRWGNATAGIRGSRSARASAGSMAVETGLMTLHEDELKGILQMLAQIARTSEASGNKLDAEPFQSRLSTLPRRARFTVSQALSALAAQAPSESSDKPTLLKLAEHIAIRFAMESYERGDIEVNAVRQVMDEMSQELDSLRKIMGVYEEKMERHGIAVQSHTDILAQQFWAQIPEEKRKAVLESSEAWCVPPAQVKGYVEGLLSRKENDEAEKVLTNYANCVNNKLAETRRQTSMGLAELAGLYAKCDERLLMNTIRMVGIQLAEERDSELQSLMSAAFVRLSQEAASKRSYPAIQRSVELVEYVETERPGLGKNLRPRIGVENRLPEFIEDALKTGEVPSGLKDLLRRMPTVASVHLAGRFSRAGFREDCDVLISMMQVLDVEGLENLREQLRKGSPNEAIETLGLLTRLDPDTVEQVLPQRVAEWKRTAHDRVVRQIASSGSPERGRLLLQLVDFLDPLIRPLAVDEIGMSGDRSADMRLLRIAEGDLPKDGTEYLRLKAIEALGRLRTTGAEAVLRKIAEARRAFRWASPTELRLVASQAMEKIDPEWLRSFVPRSGLSVAEFSIEPLDVDPNSSAIRQRRYPRLRLERPVPATTTNLKENYHMDIPELTLGGGVAICEQSLHPGSVVNMKLVTSQKTVKVQTIVRDANTQARAFEVVDMELEERSKLRKLLVQLGNSQKQTSPKERARRGTRMIFSQPA
jgi:hypothetical protein